MKIKRIESNLYQFSSIINGVETPISYNRVEDIQSAKANLESEIERLKERLIEVDLKLDLINALPELEESIESATNFEPLKRYQIKGTEKQFIDLVFNVPDLLDYVKQSSIKVYEQENYRMFYVNAFLPNHKELLEAYLGIDSITDRQNGNE